jgi:hypothetical protein
MLGLSSREELIDQTRVGREPEARVWSSLLADTGTLYGRIQTDAARVGITHGNGIWHE